jgi:hypothetical protein
VAASVTGESAEALLVLEVHLEVVEAVRAELLVVPDSQGTSDVSDHAVDLCVKVGILKRTSATRPRRSSSARIDWPTRYTETSETRIQLR